MSDTTPSVFVRGDLVGERPAPIKTTGFVGFLRTRLFNSPTNILITIVSALLLWFILVPALKFVLVDAVWTGTDRTACLPKNPGDAIGACWPFIQAKLPQFLLGRWLPLPHTNCHSNAAPLRRAAPCPGTRA